MGLCNGRIQCGIPAEQVVDADMNGIGVVLSFVITAAISVTVAIMAVIRRGIPKQQYLRIDEKVLHWIGVRRPASDFPSNLGYQSLLLALSDQMLAVGLCYLIAMYAQVCQVSLYSFFIGTQLGYLSSTVHLCTLLVLKSYFRKHPKQALLRGGLMMLFLGLLVSTLILEFITLSEPRDRLFLCGLHHPELNRVKSVGPRCFAISVMLLFVYWNAFRSIKLDNSLTHEHAGSASRNAILRWIYSSERGRADLQAYLRADEEKIRRRTQKNAAILERQPGFWKAFVIVAMPIIGEVSGSVLFELLIAIFSFSIATYTLIVGLFYQGIDTRPLLKASFGQILPMLLLIVIALTALSAVEIGTIKNSREAEMGTEVKKQLIPMLDTAHACSSSRVTATGLSWNVAGIADEASPSNSPSYYENSLTPLAAASHSQPDLSGNAGSGTRIDSMTRWMTPRRTSTIELEEGKMVLASSQEPARDNLDVALRSAKGATYTIIGVVLFLLAGLFVLCFLLYQLMVPIISAVVVLGLMLNVLLGMRGVNKSRQERFQRERQI